ncbi:MULTISPECIES: hypothetical protein [Flavobacterium]|uniref:Uncharacterized protein n=1 Tax=Flavobacterium columnare (strain ATCC 49512 / CIP 103533 / TG 44/87) TaxID=1041826 RepID=G8X5J6_FLACA|nr:MULTISPECIES: hypothetical protein [Flavobacterium]AEW86228.1 hypothetical protein FCOL_07045 [Flavobacterium columnare ATCC 49512]AMA48589.1 hypothetical protein AWN65_03495 [Flavobacterium covae]MCJ1810197.1 hypothetical protein [Flavobacterium covae]
MFFFDRLPNNPTIDYNDVDFSDAVRDNDAVNKDISFKEKRYIAKTRRYIIDTVLRIIFSVVYTCLLIIWLNKVIHILTHNNLCGYKLSDNVLIALLVTSTANVIGMVVIVLKNLFPEKNKDKKKESTSDK